MAKIDAVMDGPLISREPALMALKEEFDVLSQSTVADKTELNWPHAATMKHVAACAGLFITENVANVLGAGRGETAARDVRSAPARRGSARLRTDEGVTQPMTKPDPAPGLSTSERVSTIFSSIADRYDTFNAMASLGIDRGWRRELVRAAHISPSSRVLDLACGTGDVAFAVANLGHPAEVVATDFNAEMLAVAAEEGGRQPAGRPRFLLAGRRAGPAV